MVEFSDITTQFTAVWVPGNIQLPTMRDKDLQYSTKYPHYLFFKVYAEMPLKVISQSNNGGLVKRKQIFSIHGVYDTYANAKLAIVESKRCITEEGSWFVGGKGSISQNRKRFVFILPCYEKKYLQKTDW